MVAQVDASSHGVDGLLVHLFDVVNVRAERDLVSGSDLTSERKEAQMSDFLHCSSDFAVDSGVETGLVAIVKLAGGVHELCDESQVSPFDFVLSY